jgi:hypothetical protein
MDVLLVARRGGFHSGWVARSSALSEKRIAWETTT